jgi:hypothetical protein
MPLFMDAPVVVHRVSHAVPLRVPAQGGPPTSLRAKGTIAFLLVRDVGIASASDPVEAEVTVKLNAGLDRVMTFRFRKDAGPSAHRAILDALWESYQAGSPVVLEYDLEPVRSNGVATLLALIR